MARERWPYVERLAGKGSRQGQFSRLFQAIDRRGQGGRSEDEYQDSALDSRQACAQLLLLLLWKERGRGYPSLTSGALNDLYHENTEFDSKGQLATLFEQLLTDTQAVLAQRPVAEGRKVIRKNRLFSLFLFLRLIRFSPVDTKRALPQIAEIFWSKESDESEPVGRVGSSGTLEKHFAWFEGERMRGLTPPELDTNRLFTCSQKQEIYANAQGKCGVCREPVGVDFAEYDHIKPWILGGRTVVENGRPVHLQCHARGLAAVDGHNAPLEDRVRSSQRGL